MSSGDPGMFTGKKPSFGSFLKKQFASKEGVPFKAAKVAVDGLLAPIALSPYQIATDAYIQRKTEKPFKATTEHEIGGVKFPANHSVDLSKSSVDHKYSLGEGKKTKYNIVADHEITLGKPEYTIEEEARLEKKQQEELDREHATQKAIKDFKIRTGTENSAPFTGQPYPRGFFTGKNRYGS